MSSDKTKSRTESGKLFQKLLARRRDYHLHENQVEECVTFFNKLLSPLPQNHIYQFSLWNDISYLFESAIKYQPTNLTCT